MNDQGGLLDNLGIGDRFVEHGPGGTGGVRGEVAQPGQGPEGSFDHRVSKRLRFDPTLSDQVKVSEKIGMAFDQEHHGHLVVEVFGPPGSGPHLTQVVPIVLVGVDQFVEQQKIHRHRGQVGREDVDRPIVGIVIGSGLLLVQPGQRFHQVLLGIEQPEQSQFSTHLLHEVRTHFLPLVLQVLLEPFAVL